MNIIITGASRGIGFEVVKRLTLETGNRVLALSRNYAALEKLQNACREETGSDILIKKVDLSENGFQDQLSHYVEKELKRVDILINNAGSLINKPFGQMDPDDFDKMFSVNIKGVFLLTRMMLPHLNRPSHIVNIGSMGGVQGSVKFPGLSLYSASKGALAILTECLAEELKNEDIRVNCLALGSAQTEMLSAAFPGFQSPLTATEMATFIADFAREGYKYFNGKILPVAVTTP